MKSTKRTLLLALIFAIAMGILEAIVVVYLRKIFHSTGIKFPLQINPGPIIKIEMLREFCTLVMLVSIAYIAGKNKLQAFSYFLFCFAVWDLSYYAGLKLIINWPSSFFTWDILFLIPFPWISPVLAPIISSVTMIILSLVILFIQNKINNFKVKGAEWLLIYLGAALVFISFMWDYAGIIISRYLYNFVFTSPLNGFKNITSNYFAKHFVWYIFMLGILSIYFSIFLMLKRYVTLKTNR